MSIGRRVRKILFWATLLSACILAGGLWCAFLFLTDGETAARLIRQEAIKYLPGSFLDPGRVKIGLFKGQATLSQATLRQSIDGAPFQALDIPFLNIQFDAQKLGKGQLKLLAVNVGHPTLRLQQRRNGTWNIQGLLAVPWPDPLIEDPPPIKIQNGTVELVTADESPASTIGPALPGRPVAAARAPAILRDVTLTVEGNGAVGLFKFEGSARGDLLFDKLSLSGTVDVNTGEITLEGDLSGLTLSETLRRRLPPEAQPVFNAIALNGGVVDVELSRFRVDPRAPMGSRLRYQAQATLRDGVWECTKLPFSVTELRAGVSLEDGVMTIKYAQGSNGKTDLRARGSLSLDDPKKGPLDLTIGVTDLELDKRLRDRTPAEYDELWDLFKPRGQVDATIQVVRRQVTHPVELAATVKCRDVGAIYRHFAYPLEHL